jgi:hypothetical protein
MWFKTFMSESIVWFKRPENQSRILKWKIRSVMEWKCFKNINSPSGDQYRTFTRILQKCFSRIVEPCRPLFTVQWNYCVLKCIHHLILLRSPYWQTWGQLLSNVIDYITITFQFSWLHYITITSIFKCNRLNYNYFVNVINYITDYI